MTNVNKNVLILGSTGMVGRAVYLYLHSLFPQSVWGTTRNEKQITKNILNLKVENLKKDYALIQKKIGKIDYVINCIAVTNNTYTTIKDLILVNALFPHSLEDLAEKNKFKLIHISTDAVFAPLSLEVNEASEIGPIDTYGCSKLLGETTSQNSLTFRSSFIGPEPINHNGLLEKVIMSQDSFYGFTDQIWSGCTTLQFAKLCESIIVNDKFNRLRKEANIYHFAPLGPISKFELIKILAKKVNKDHLIKRSEGGRLTRSLKTNYAKLLDMSIYTKDVTTAIKETINLK